jgi:acyl-CoA synthetase (AMP-forming)/AMP-acid ligase II
MHVPLTTRDFLRRAETVYADRIGIVDEPDRPASWGAIDYRTLAARARSVGAGLDALGVGAGERVAIVSQNASRFVAALHGVCNAGRILVPINFRLHAHEVAYIVEHSGARVLLVDPELDASLANVKTAHRLTLDEASDEALFFHAGTPRPVAIDEATTATLNYTSGTTARPKGVRLTHRNLWINATTFGWHAGVCDRDVYLHVLPTFHANGWGMPFATAAMGAKQVVLRKVDGAEILRRVDAHGVTLICGAPAVVAAVLDAAAKWSGPIPGRDRTRIVVAGAPPPTRTIERVQSELGWEFIQIYGLTETSPLLTMNRARAEYDGLDARARAVALGRAGAPVVGVEVQADEHGEILARGNVVMDGYWEDAMATSIAVRDDWFHTGDGGTIDAHGYVSISDRKKDVIISGGENVSSIEVEDCLASHADVAEVAVIGVPDEKWGETVKALVVLRAGSRADEMALLAHCRERLAHYKCPTSIELRTELARTATGKLQKFLLRAPYWEGRTKQVN